MSNSVNEFIQKLNDTFTEIDTLNQMINAIASCEANFRQNQANTRVSEELSRRIQAASLQYKNSLADVSKLIDMVDNFIVQTGVTSGGTNQLSLPSAESVSDMMKSFFIGKIKTRPSPMPIGCGCYAYKVKNPKQGSFVCAKYNDAFVLMIAVQYVSQQLTVINPANVKYEINPIEVAYDDWTPLPTVIPDKPIGRWEHSKDSNILSLYQQNEKDDSWTTFFFTAKVLQRPCDKSSDQGERGYTLDFGNEIIQNVPEQFVVNLPDPWKPLSEKTLLKDYLNPA